MNDVQIANEDLGHIEQITGYVKATLTRRLDHPAVKVCAMLTESSHIKDWLAPGKIELTKGGQAKLNFGDSGIIIDSEVSECETNQLLEYSWSNSKCCKSRLYFYWRICLFLRSYCSWSCNFR